MSISKHPYLRYLIIDRCLRNRFRHYTISDIASECCDALCQCGEKKDTISERQVRKDIEFLENNPLILAPVSKRHDGHKVYYSYDDPSFSISKMPLTEDEIAKLREALNLLSRFRGMPQFAWIEDIVAKLEAKLLIKSEQSAAIIGFEEPPLLESVEYLECLFKAICNQNALQIDYQPFDNSPITWKISPYYIKQFNNRWFLFGQNNDEPTRGLTTIPLDRIAAITVLAKDYIVNTRYDFNEYFDDIIGVTIPSGVSPERIVFTMSPARVHHIRTKPLHASQKHLRQVSPTTFEITVIPNPELYAQLLSFGADLEVVSPECVRNEVKRRIKSMIRVYNKCEPSVQS